MANHHPHLRLDAVLGIVLAEEMDHFPVRGGEQESFLPRLHAREIFRPLAAVDEVALTVGFDALAADVENAREGAGNHHVQRDRIRRQTTSVSLPRAGGRYTMLSLRERR